MTLTVSHSHGRRARRRISSRRAEVNPGHAAYVSACAGDVPPGQVRVGTTLEGRALAMTGPHPDWSRGARGVSTVALRVGGSVVTQRLGGAAVLGLVVWQLGLGSSLHALRAIDAWSLGAALVLTAATTVCCAWRWRLVAAGLGADVPLRPAVAACYRSQFLNTATPGGVLGDVHRGVRLGRRHGDTGKGLRSVIWERSAGQVVQAVMALVVLTVLPSPLRPVLGWVWVAVVVGAAGVLVGRLARRRPDAGWVSARVTATLAELRRALFARRTWPLVVLASALAVMGHVLTFVVAARTAGATAPTARLVPLAFVVLVSMGVPLNVAGWGPREGVAAWAFGAAGLGADAGLSTAVVYGVLVFAASLPGAVVMLVANPGRTRPARAQLAEAVPAVPVPVLVSAPVPVVHSARPDGPGTGS